MDRIECVGWPGDAIGRLHDFLLKGAEHPVPDDEDASVVPVDVLRIAAVVDAVMGRGVHDPLEWPHPVDQFGVNPELVQQVDGHAGEEHLGWESDHGEGPIHPHHQDLLQYALAQGDTQVVVLALVVDDMTNPEDVDFVCRPVCPVIGEIREHECGGPHGPVLVECPWPPLCCPMEYRCVCAHGDDLGEQGAGLVHDPAADVGHAVPQAVESLALELVPYHLQSDEGEEDGDGKDNQIHGGSKYAIPQW